MSCLDRPLQHYPCDSPAFDGLDLAYEAEDEFEVCEWDAIEGDGVSPLTSSSPADLPPKKLNEGWTASGGHFAKLEAAASELCSPDQLFDDFCMGDDSTAVERDVMLQSEEEVEMGFDSGDEVEEGRARWEVPALDVDGSDDGGDGWFAVTP